MKKIILYLLLLLILCFVLPALCSNGAKEVFSKINFKSQESEDTNSNVNDNKQEDANNNIDTESQESNTDTTLQESENSTSQENESQDNNAENESSSSEKYQYKAYSTIKLLHTETGVVEEFPIDEYLLGVVASEMPADFDIEALKAQAIVARTYTIYQIRNNSAKHENADVCDDSSCCQAWITKEDRFARWEENLCESNWAKIEEAVNSTQGKIITYNGSPINAFFHSNSGGTTESSVNIWGGVEYPYLQAVETAGEDGYTQYSSEVTLTNEEILSKMKEKYSDIQIDFSDSESIKILEYNSSGRVKTCKIGNKELSGVEARTIFGLRSANFEISRNGENVTFSVKGYGHGVGMSQTGADSMAKSGSNYEEIIKHFYTDVQISNVNDIN